MISSQAKAFAKDHGLRGWAAYVVGRGSVLGDVDADVVTAAFGFWPSDIVRESWDAGRAAITARRGPHRVRRRLPRLGPSALRRPRRRRPARRAALVGGRRRRRRRAAAVRRLARRRAPGRRPRRGSTSCCTCLREHRGGTHLVAVVASGLSPLQAVLTGPGGTGNASFFGWEEPFEDVSGHVHRALARPRCSPTASSAPAVRRPRPRRARRAARAARARVAGRVPADRRLSVRAPCRRPRRTPPPRHGGADVVAHRRHRPRARHRAAGHGRHARPGRHHRRRLLTPVGLVFAGRASALFAAARGPQPRDRHRRHAAGRRSRPRARQRRHRHPRGAHRAARPAARRGGRTGRGDPHLLRRAVRPRAAVPRSASRHARAARGRAGPCSRPSSATCSARTSPAGPGSRSASRKRADAPAPRCSACCSPATTRRSSGWRTSSPASRSAAATCATAPPACAS